MILHKVESPVFTYFKTMGAIDEIWVSGRSCTGKGYDKDKLMPQSFIEEKLSNMSNVLPSRFMGLLS